MLTKVTVVPTTVHTEAVAELNATTKPDDDVAEMEYGMLASNLLASGLNVMVCDPLVITTLAFTADAAL